MGRLIIRAVPGRISFRPSFTAANKLGTSRSPPQPRGKLRSGTTQSTAKIPRQLRDQILTHQLEILEKTKKSQKRQRLRIEALDKLLREGRSEGRSEKSMRGIRSKLKQATTKLTEATKSRGTATQMIRRMGS